MKVSICVYANGVFHARLVRYYARLQSIGSRKFSLTKRRYYPVIGWRCRFIDRKPGDRVIEMKVAFHRIRRIKLYCPADRLKYQLSASSDPFH